MKIGAILVQLGLEDARWEEVLKVGTLRLGQSDVAAFIDSDGAYATAGPLADGLDALTNPVTERGG